MEKIKIKNKYILFKYNKEEEIITWAEEESYKIYKIIKGKL